jgi:alkylation response protein AidB-like acyl-CoA dehydrogenase
MGPGRWTCVQTARQQELIERARALARERFAPRAAAHDRDATFPFDDYADRAPRASSACLRAGNATAARRATTRPTALVAEQLAQGNASTTSLTFNMHCLTMLMMGEIADAMPMRGRARARTSSCARRSSARSSSAGVLRPAAQRAGGAGADRHAALSMGGRRFGTTARKVDGGYVVNGAKFFVSLAGSAPYFATPAIRLGDEPWIERTLYLQVPKDAPGVTFPGEWDPDGHARHGQPRHGAAGRVRARRGRGPPARRSSARMYNAFPHLSPLTFCATFLGLMQARVRLRDRLSHRGDARRARAAHRGRAAKGHAVAEMLFTLEATRALYYRPISEARVDCAPDAVQRARAARTSPCSARAVTVTQEAIRVCGGARPAQALPARALRARRARRRAHAPVDAGDSTTQQGVGGPAAGARSPRIADGRRRDGLTSSIVCWTRFVRRPNRRSRSRTMEISSLAWRRGR